MAFESAHITAAAVVVVEYPELVRHYRVTGVPKTVINDRVEILGAVSEDAFLTQLLESVA